ncbi:MAG: hypothetical protein MCSN_4850 [Candidatus Microsyncoccus archaeolyticus]|jgi:hypothetical protein|nr:MAG: hypothetical protein MCSN_4850 [Candidatus Parcubacteria bacterium]
MEKALFTVGVFGGIFNSQGKLLLRKRDMNGSYPGKWELPGGAIQKKHLEIGDERAIGKALQERILEELDVLVFVQRMPSMYPAMPLNGDDIAFAIIIGKLHEETHYKGEIRFVDVGELNSLAESGEFLSGKGRMYRMCLRMFASRDCPSPEYRKKAGELLSLL